jgi:hypothetical protein
MTHEPEHHRDETDLQGLLRSVDLDTPNPDLAALNALRQRAANEFAQAAAAEGLTPPTAVSPIDSTPTIPKDRRSSMLVLAIRGSLALSAAVALLAVWLNPFAPQVAGGSIPFSKVMEELRGASTLHLQLEKGGQTSEILVRVPGLVRKQDSPQRYQIAAGSRWWKIDEAENTVSEGDSPWFLSLDKQIDLLKLLEVGVKDATPLLVARPYQRTTYGGRDCYAYRVDLPGEQGRVHVEAFAEVTNNQLVGITARDVADEKGAKQPLAELRLVAVNQPMADEQFAVAKSLTEDGRIGKVSESQGIVVLRPMLAKRWTPVCRETLLRLGDWLRTELRGANAVKITLASEVELTLGPGSLIECISPTQARLHNGQVQVKVGGKPDKAASFTLLAPRTGERAFKAEDKQLVRVDREEKLVDVAQTPVWLAGFEGTTSNESLGSLIVNLPDGRNEPLTVGYHKVSVEIRDQIARTTIEESFVNHTPTRLEGVFHFPLPHDASISGFGMWIGNDLVEADVVEKQRAREIFETILREKRDPGLLEWMGGNIFKARVFPIEAHSEKRIKIVYTQVLPLRANRYRYSYGLRSELLRTKPLRELSLNVTVNSAIPLKAVSCPTHTVRTQQTPHSAQVEFTAREYTPTRDFEVVCEVDGKQSDVVVIPHRRGNDGYFLLQLTPPGPEGNWQRELLPDGKSLNVVLLCDTSSSMDSEKRRQQAEFVSAVLMSLSSDDHFQLACADVGTAWLSAEPLSVNAENAAKARAFLDERVSLGWTNLDRAFADVIQKSPADAQVLYVGDGIVSAGSTDPAAFVQRLKQLISKAEKPASGTRRVFRSISVGNSHEAVVLKGIASTTGGSSRAITNEQTPQIIALELLNEIAQPGLRDLNIEFRGLKVAAVYPEQLPNIAAGTQQILVGRYLPEGKDQSGEIVITGMRGNEKVKYATHVNLKDAEAGNSFIPRLWARGHLDQLLAQGQSSQIKDEIIGLSEEFHIITPYTSLLVLESDADRERFGVKRRYEMRDGEKFFAEGRSNANFELLQAQMKRAGDWRLGLRRQILLGLNDLGRHPQLLQQQLQQAMNPYYRSGGWYDNGPMGGPMSYAGSMRGMGGGMGFGDSMDFVNFDTFLGDQPVELFATKSDDFGVIKDMKDGEDLSLAVAEPQSADRDDDLKSLSDSTVFDGRMDFQDGFADAISVNGLLSNGRAIAIGGKRSIMDAKKTKKSELGRWAFDAHGDRNRGRVFKPYRTLGYSGGPDYTGWLNSLFPTLEARPLNRPAVRPADAWSADAIELSKSLSRTDSLRKFEGGIEFQRVVDQLDPIWNRRFSRHRDLVLYSPSGWLTKPLNPLQQTVIHYCTGRERGTYSSSFLLGRQRPAVDTDFGPEAMGLYDGSVLPLHEQFRDRIARVEPAGQDRVKLILTMKDSTFAEQLLVDTAKHVLIKHEWFDGERLTSSETRDDFVEVAGSWWPQKVSHLDDAGRKTSETTFDVQGLPRPRFTERLDQELAARPLVQFIQLPFVKLSDAQQKVADGTAAFDDELAMILHSAQSQQWEQMWKYVDAMEKQTVGKPGLRWIRTMLLQTIRRNEEGRDRLLAEAKDLVAKPQPEELFFTTFILGQAQSVSSSAELLEFVQLLKPLYERQPAELEVMLQWTGWMATCQEGLGNYEQVLALKKSIAEQGPWNPYWQTDYAQRLSQAGQFDVAHAWLQKELARPVKRRQEDEEVLRSVVADLYRTQSRWGDLLKFTTEWIALKPTTHSYNSAYAQHLSALIFNDKVDDAYATAQQWMNDSQVEGKLTADQQIRLDVAVNFALGSAYNLSYQRMEERWKQPLGKLVRYYVLHAQQLDLASRIFTHHQFQQSDIADQLRGEFFAMLQADTATLSSGLINNLVSWTMSGRMEAPVPILGRNQLDASEIPTALWKEIAASLRSRWEKSQTKFEKQQLSEALNSIYSNRFRDDLLLPFLRERITSAPADLKQAYISSLFEALLLAQWTDAIEQEAFDRLKELSDTPDANDRLIVEVPALYRLVDSMLANRQRIGERKLTDQGGLDKLTRKELAAKKLEIQRAGKAELAARLQQEAKKTNGPLSNWLKIERTWIEVKLGQDLAAVAETCWKILGDAPPQPVNHDNDVDDAIIANVEQTPPVVDPKENVRLLESNLKQRALTTVIKLALLKSAKADDVARIMKFIDIGIQQGRAAAVKPVEGDAKPAETVDVNEASRTWRNAKFRVLIALDRADELEKELRAWIRDDVSTGPWRQSLARLLAERGKLDEAIQMFEACQKDNLLSASDFKQLADWYLVTDRRDLYERSRIESYKVMPEWQLNQLVYQLAQRWEQQNAALTVLDEDTLLAFKALFEKSAVPETYLWQLRSLYANSRDFRTLQMMPDSLMGRTPQQIYAFLQQLNGTILSEVRNEAPADEILARIKVLRAGERTVTDLRALDLLEALVERKSSEVLNQPGPHIDACLAALRRAFERQWGPGEPRMMSSFLFNLGGLPEKLAAEQLREMKELQKLAPALSRDHLSITSDLCQLIGSTYSRLDEAIREMAIEVRDYSQANGNQWPHADIEALNRFVSLYEQAGQYMAAESVLQKLLLKPEHAEQRKWLTNRLMPVYNQALEHDGAVSFGSGRSKLFEPIYKYVLKQIDESLDENERYILVSQLTSTFEIANRHKVTGTADIVRSFAFEVMPVLLKKQISQYRNTVTSPMRSIADICGPKDALRYVVERMEKYPQRLEISWESCWQSFANELGSRRQAVGASDLDDRVLKLVIRELQRDLRTGEPRNQVIYYQHDQHFWKEKADEFAKAAEAVLAEYKTSGRRSQSVARYFWSGLPKQDRAIEILLIAHRQTLLDAAAQQQLVNWLHERQRFAESIPIIEGLIAIRPDQIEFRVLLMQAYFRSQRPQQLAELIQQTHDHFHQEGRWTEHNAAALGGGCSSCSDRERAVGYMTEAIALHQRANPRSGLNDGTLSNYYATLAHTYSALGRTKEAVDAASAALICWGPTSQQRADQLNTLMSVVRSAADLDDYVKHLDAEAAKSGQDSAILRKAIGIVYQEKNEFAKAIPQLRVAVDLQPNDVAIHRALVACYDATNDRPAGTRQLLKLIDLRRSDLPLYQELADRLQGNEAEAERAATSIVEASPNEAENQAVMAELRQKQDRWAEAIPHWELVAEFRKLEPNGLLKLAEAQLHQKQWDAARATILKLRKTDWPARFNNVQFQASALESLIPK